jgi:hypothetical protein
MSGFIMVAVVVGLFVFLLVVCLLALLACLLSLLLLEVVSIAVEVVGSSENERGQYYYGLHHVVHFIRRISFWSDTGMEVIGTPRLHFTPRLHCTTSLLA